MSDTTKAGPSKMTKNIVVHLAKKKRWADILEDAKEIDAMLAPILAALRVGLVHARASHFVNLNSYADDVRVIEDAIALLSPPAEKES